MLKNEGFVVGRQEAKEEKIEPVEEPKQDLIVEEASVPQDDIQEEKVETIQEEKVEETKQDNGEAILGLLHKYKELQKLK